MKEGSYVDVHAAFVTMVVFSKGHFDDKLQALFTVFDIDGNGGIERSELSLFIKASVIGLCKMTGLPTPSPMGIQ